jgi:hypothetical protein
MKIKTNEGSINGLTEKRKSSLVRVYQYLSVANSPTFTILTEAMARKHHEGAQKAALDL